MNSPKRVLDPLAYTHVFERWRGARIIEFWGHGNVGDELIRRGAEQLYSFFEITVTRDPISANAVFYGGGGNMGPLYPNTRRTRLHARDLAKGLGIPIIVLPQSWTGVEEFDADQLFAREHWSLEFCPSAILAPDLGLAYEPPITIPPLFTVWGGLCVKTLNVAMRIKLEFKAILQKLQNLQRNMFNSLLLFH